MTLCRISNDQLQSLKDSVWSFKGPGMLPEFAVSLSELVPALTQHSRKSAAAAHTLMHSGLSALEHDQRHMSTITACNNVADRVHVLCP